MAVDRESKRVILILLQAVAAVGSVAEAGAVLHTAEAGHDSKLLCYDAPGWFRNAEYLVVGLDWGYQRRWVAHVNKSELGDDLALKLCRRFDSRASDGNGVEAGWEATRLVFEL